MQRIARVGKYMMSSVTSVGTQAGIFDTRVVASYILDLLKKCHEIHELFKKSTEELQEGRENIVQREQMVVKMQTTVNAFSETMDNLGVRLLQGNIAAHQRNAHIDKLRKDIAEMTECMENAERPDQRNKQQKEERLQEIKMNRVKLEQQLRKVNADIDSAYEEMFETQEKLTSLKDARELRREAENEHIATIKNKATNTKDRKRDILTVVDGNAFDMSEMYVSPTAFAVLEADIETLKHQQKQVDRHIQMQMEERAYLRDVANSIIQRVFELEKKVRKETGDHGWESALTSEPNWQQDMSAPSIWHTSPPLSVEQLKRLQESHYQHYTHAHAICDREETEATTGETSDDIVVIDIKNEEGSE
ncbi:uncharacterized protein LOC123537393 [Mercenaria mercenaria]|uniref:uncharacterized protein LOC123537393 n=1 Tax=Mercenaria mercenaria TaxID=6596 RepID=UPI00234F6D10|nr:uncharacterized protein LOC123537393 [Mercenaria mercenaria]